MCKCFAMQERALRIHKVTSADMSRIEEDSVEARQYRAQWFSLLGVVAVLYVAPTSACIVLILHLCGVI